MHNSTCRSSIMNSIMNALEEQFDEVELAMITDAELVRKIVTI